MASLYDTAKNIRIVLIGFGIFALIIIGNDIFQNWQLQNQINSPVALGQRRFYMDPDRKFGDVPLLKIPSLQDITYNTSNFIIESIYPAFPDVAYVYKVEQPTIRANTSENALSVARNLGYSNLDGGDLDAPIYNWYNFDRSKQLRYDLQTSRWSLTTDYFNNTEAKSTKKLLPRTDAYVGSILSMFRKIGFLGYGIERGETEIKLAVLNLNGEFREVTSINQADYIVASARRNILLADLKPKELRPSLLQDEILPSPYFVNVLKLDPRKGSIDVVVSNNLSDYAKDLFELRYTDFKYNDINRGGYLISSPAEAFTNLQRGLGALTYLGPSNADHFENYRNIQINRIRFDARRTQLGYYEPELYSNNGLIIPIYIFRGAAELDDGRLATVIFYIDAIKRI
jgi:hypothetical protein